MKRSIGEEPLLLVRHVPVAQSYQGLCYGRSDVPLDEHGRRLCTDLAGELSNVPAAGVLHSGLTRTRLLAERLGEQIGCPVVECPALQERDFGNWELRPWDEIYAAHGEEMLGVVTQPQTYRPGGGETTFELRDRVLEWFSALPAEGPMIAVTHGGPIAALLGTLQRRPVHEWTSLIPRCGESVRVPRRPLQELPLAMGLQED